MRNFGKIRPVSWRSRNSRSLLGPTVTSARQRNANRANAKRSTGPRTEAGNADARLNAWRHGLAASLLLRARRG